MVERKGNIPNVPYRNLVGLPDDGVDELAALRAAVELHRPQLLNRYGGPTDKVEDAKWIRCDECHESVPVEGCKTWRTAHPAKP